MSNGKLVILAGGASSRMKRAAQGPIDHHTVAEADTKPKSMISMGKGSRPFLDYLLYHASEAGYRDIVIVVGEGDQAVRSYYGSAEQGNSFYGLTIGYVEQPIPPGRIKPLGTADALARALRARPDWRGKRFTVCNSDNLYSIHALTLVRESASACALIDYDRAALRFDQRRIEQFAVLIKRSDGALAEIIEKPTSDDIARARDHTGRVGVSMNVFGFTYESIAPFLELVPMHPERQEKELPVAVRMMVRAGTDVMMTIPLSEHVPDLSSKDDIIEVRAYLARAYPSGPFRKQE